MQSQAIRRTHPAEAVRAIGGPTVRLWSPLMMMAAGLPGLSVPASAAGARSAVLAMRAPELAITVPTSAALGGAAPGGTISAHLGTVKVDDGRLVLANWTATASATNFVTGGGSAAETIAKSRLSYWSGPATATTGVGVRVPGQLTAANAVSLANPVTAFALQAVVLGTSTSWNPTIVVAVPAGAVAGTYTGTVTHPVA